MEPEHIVVDPYRIKLQEILNLLKYTKHLDALKVTAPMVLLFLYLCYYFENVSTFSTFPRLISQRGLVGGIGNPSSFCFLSFAGKRKGKRRKTTREKTEKETNLFASFFSQSLPLYFCLYRLVASPKLACHFYLSRTRFLVKEILWSKI